jgi:DNA-binding LacI/PurR family transcriptional regulator
MANIKDVAKKAGVSIGTVSLVLNGSSAIRESTGKRVFDAAEALRYRPNLNARSLVTKKNLIIGVVRCIDRLDHDKFNFSSTVDTYLAEMLKSIEQESMSHKYSLMVDWSETFYDTEKLPGMYDSGKVDGVLMVGGIINGKLPEMIKKSGVPTVMVGSRNSLMDYVDTSYTKAIRIAVDYLVSMGHRDIAFINGPDVSQTSAQKLNGYSEALKANGLGYREDFISKGDFSGHGGYLAMQGICRKCCPTALVAAVDCIAIGALHFMYEQRYYCPEDISVVGFEDGILAEYAIPPLTTVSGEKEALGRIACEILLKRIREPDCPIQNRIVEPKLVERKSVRRISHGVYS